MFEFDLQRFGGGGTKTVNEVRKVPKISATEQGLQDLAVGYGTTNLDYANQLNKLGTDSLTNVLNIDYNKLYGDLTNQLGTINEKYTALLSGELPSSYAANKNQYITQGLSELGGVLNTGAQRGVINSSISERANKDINTRTAEAMGKQYSSDIALQQGLLNDAYANAYKPIEQATNAQAASLSVPASYYTMGTGLGSTLTDTWNNMANRRYSLASTPQTVATGSSGLFSGLGSVAGALIGCVDENTLVETPDGKIPIKEIVSGDKVKGENGFSKVQLVSMHHAECFDIVMENNVLTCTKTQPIQIDNGIFKTIDEISTGDKLSGKEVYAIVSVGIKLVYELKTEDINFYANDILVEGYTEKEFEEILQQLEAI